MARQKDQVLIYNDQELELIKSVFAENEELIYIIRKVLLQFPLTESEEIQLRGVMNEEVYQVLKKRIFPEMSDDFPLGQIGDLYQTLTNDLKVKSVEDMVPLFDAKQLELEYLELQFTVLKNLGTNVPQTIRLSELATLKDKTGYQRYVDTTARNFLLGFIDPMLIMIKNLAGQKNETLEETKARIQRNSNK
jgi:hypothetical protein